MNVTIWGARGSIPAPGPETTRYGGNTSCVHIELSDGSDLILDAGTGIRTFGLTCTARETPLHILLTHLHLDHIQGLMFFAPLFQPQAEVIIWGPPAPDGTLQDRIARYISAPLAPVEVRELPCSLDFRECDSSEWRIGPATVRASPVVHRGPTLGFRIEDAGRTVAYIPDHEPALGRSIEESEDEWISGLHLARDADLLFHDGQYTSEEYPRHLGWGHSSVHDAVRFAERARVRRTMLFHHDPLHNDEMLDRLETEVDASAELAREGQKLGV